MIKYAGVPSSTLYNQSARLVRREGSVMYIRFAIAVPVVALFVALTWIIGLSHAQGQGTGVGDTAVTADASPAAAPDASQRVSPEGGAQGTLTRVLRRPAGEPIRPAADDKAAVVPSQSIVVQGQQTILNETFEGIYPSGLWTLYGNPTWDDTNYAAHGGSWSAWCGDTGLDPALGYANNMNAWMVYGPFDLSGATDATVDFWYKNLSEYGWDFFGWYASIDNASYYGYSVTGDQNTWRSQLFDLKSVYTLGNLCGQPQVWIAFVFESDDSIAGPTYSGAYVDDIVITRTTLDNLPDLQVPNAQAAAATVTEGNAFWVRGRIYNGGQTAAGSSHVKAYLSTDGDADTNDDYYLGEKPVGALSVGAEEWVQWDFNMPDIGAGTYGVYVVYVVDSQNEVVESSEANSWITNVALFTASDLPGQITGSKWNDLDGDGNRDAGEPGLPGWKIYIDTNFSGSWESGEPYALTDSSGVYTLSNVTPGIHIVGEVQQSGWQQTYPAVVPPPAPARAVEPITTTGSPVRTRVYGEVVPSTPGRILPSTAQSSPLINLNAFRADPRFSAINGQGVAVAVLDTGIDLNHPFFGPDANSDGVADRIVYQYDFGDNDSNAGDFDGHGSNVASIIGSQDATYKGMAPAVNLIALKVFPDGGDGDFAMVEQALQWVVANAASRNIVAINMSLGDGENWTTAGAHYGIGEELAALAAQNVIVCSASGNEFYAFNSGQGIAYPSADPNSLSIGAVYDANTGGWTYASGAVANASGPDFICPFSQRHATLTTVFAPGAVITGANATGGTVQMHGTSQASPHIAGIAALAQQLAQQRLGRRLTMTEFAALLRTTGVTITDGDDENDNVVNTNLQFKRVDVLALANAIWSMGLPGTHTVQVGSNQTVPNINFGNKVSSVSMTFQAAVGNTGSHADMTALNYASITYTRPDNTTGTATAYDGSSAVVQVKPGSTYTYSATSSGSTVTHRWYCNGTLSGSVPSSGSQTVSRIYYDQYMPTITLAGTTGTCSVSTEARLLYGASHPDTGLFTIWTDWCDAGSTLTFSQLTTGTLQKKTTDTRSWTVNSAFAATINYWPQGDITHDDKVNVLDLQRMTLSWNKQQGQPGYDPACDLTGDNRVNVFDLQIMARNWNQW